VPSDDLSLGQKVPNKSEGAAVGLPTGKIKKGTTEFDKLKKNANPDIVFKNEEGDDSDRMMTVNLTTAANKLASLVKSEWSGIKLRITEAWDDLDEHSTNSTHYEARAADLSTSDVDQSKLGRLGRLAVNAGFGWVFYEDASHVHASVIKDPALPAGPALAPFGMVAAKKATAAKKAVVNTKKAVVTKKAVAKKADAKKKGTPKKKSAKRAKTKKSPPKPTKRPA
jgi:hypothetical protein